MCSRNDYKAEEELYILKNSLYFNTYIMSLHEVHLMK